MSKQPSEKDAASAVSKPDAIQPLREEHRRIRELLDSRAAAPAERKAAILSQAFDAWIRHSLLEEEILLPAAKAAGLQGETYDDAEIERDVATVLLADLRSRPGADLYEARLRVFVNHAQGLIEQEEAPDDGLFAKTESLGLDLESLAARLSARREELNRAASLPDPAPRHLTLPHDRKGQRGQRKETDTMPNQSNNRERDDRGRFTSDDDRGGRSRSSRSSFDDDRRSYRSRDDDDDRRGGRGHGGWFGDPEGHSRASREGWDDRGFSASRRYDEDDRRSSRSRDDDDDDRRGGNGRGRGWFGDPEGHSRASREGWDDRGSSASRRYDEDDRRSSRSGDDDDDRRGGRGHGGWFGDPEGHSRASREGWDDRGSSARRSDEDDRRSYRSRDDRDDDDDGRRGGSGRGRGWSGDPEGHSEASRRGWQNRRD